MNHRQATFGFTLIELLVAIAVLAVLLSVGAPAFRDHIERNRLRGVTETVYSDLELARSEAIARNQTIFASFNPGTNWCYGLDDTAACDCTQANDCQIDGQTKVVNSTGFADTSIATTFGLGVAGSNDTAFEPRRGTTMTDQGNGNGNVTVQLNNASTQIRLGLLGRATICSDDLYQYDSCTP